MVLYMAVTNDKYELPLIITETLTELSNATGACNDYICKCIKHELVTYKYDKEKGNKFVRVYIDEEEDSLKHGKKPSKKQMIRMSELGLDYKKWLVVKDSMQTFEIVHRQTGEVRNFSKEK